jgi:D-aspartate ligase
MKPPAILVGGQASTLSVARSLGAAGIEVAVVAEARTSPVRHSRHCGRFLDVPGGPDLQERWLERLLELPPGVVLPCTDEALELVARRRAELVTAGHFVYDCDDELALAMLDKERTYALAREAGIRAPRTAPVADAAGLRVAVERIGFPCGLKPVSPIEFRRVYGLRRKLFLAEDSEQLEAAFEETSARGLAMLLTEIVPGPDESLWGYLAYIGADGRPLVETSKRKLRQWPPHFGIGSYHVTAHDDEVIELGRRFVTAVGLRGFAGVELKRDARTGELVLIECNQRFINPTELLRAAGVDVALVAYDQARGRIPEPQPEAAEGVRLLFLVEDGRSFLEQRRAGELSTAGWVRSLVHRQRFPVFSARDPLPSLSTNAALVGGIVGRRLKRLAAGARGRRAA